MKRLVILAAAVLLMISAFSAGASGTAGSQSDPAITLSYIDDVFVPQVLSAVGTKAADRIRPLYAAALSGMTGTYENRLGSIDKNAAAASVYNAVKEKAAESVGLRSFAVRFAEITLKKGDVLTGDVGTGIILRAGSAQITGAAGKPVINITLGAEVFSGSAVAANARYMLCARDSTGITVLSDTARVAVDGAYTVKAGYTAVYTDLADALKAMNLFRGTNSGYELTRSATRLEALIMLIRLIGEEEQALSHSAEHPFGDVPKWADDQADKYVAYAFDMGYTKGTSADKFSPGSSASPQQYVTFLLRALGYTDRDDGSGDFVWSSAVDAAKQVGLLKASEAEAINKTFLRDQVVYTSYYALSTKLKGSSRTLLDQLVLSGAVSRSAADAAMAKVTRTRPAS